MDEAVQDGVREASTAEETAPALLRPLSGYEAAIGGGF